MRSGGQQSAWGRAIFSGDDMIRAPQRILENVIRSKILKLLKLRTDIFNLKEKQNQKEMTVKS